MHAPSAKATRTHSLTKPARLRQPRVGLLIGPWILRKGGRCDPKGDGNCQRTAHRSHGYSFPFVFHKTLLHCLAQFALHSSELFVPAFYGSHCAAWLNRSSAMCKSDGEDM